MGIQQALSRNGNDVRAHGTATGGIETERGIGAPQKFRCRLFPPIKKVRADANQMESLKRLGNGR
jgi:hypothetical protein